MTGTGRSTLLAFDFGSQSIGVAAGSVTNGLPTPLSAVRASRSGPDWQEVDRIVAEWSPAGFVVGLALNARGEETDSSRRARKFGRRLAERYNRPVHWIDETLSTEAARRALRDADAGRAPRKRDVDSAAAALILESFLHAQQ